MVDIRQVSSTELEQLLEEYPWFNVARKEYLSRALGENPSEKAIREAVRHAGIFLLSRAEFVKLISGKKNYVPAREVEAPKQQYYVVGGDYFGREDFEELERQGLSVKTPAFGPIADSLGEKTAPDNQRQTKKRNDCDEICTETLAGIYFQQEIYPKAIEIYEKLILLYPEKSAYFATLIEKVKNIK